MGTGILEKKRNFPTTGRINYDLLFYDIINAGRRLT